VSAAFGDRAGVQDDDPVGSAGSLQAVGDDDGGPAVGHLIHGGSQPGLGGEVEVGGSFVEQQDRGIDKFGSGKGQ